MRRYYIYTVLVSAVGILGGCSEKPGNDDVPPQGPSSRSVAEIQYVSRLTDGTLIASEADFSSINDYMVNTLEGKEKASLTVLDRMDGVSVARMMQLSVNTYRWTAYALNNVTSASASEGSAVYFNEPASSIMSYKSGDGAWLCGFTPSVAGAFQKLDAEGNVTSSNNVNSDVNFYTVRLSTEEQISGFGGVSGAMNTVKTSHRNMIVIGTVKNSLFSKLQSAVASVDSAYKAIEIVKGTDYTLFMVSADRYWNYYDVQETQLNGGIKAYAVHVGWK
ncbi:MAG: hypothetical protein NC115_12510 [Bacteroidales bacterium]|nr:hypothetical protein [Bacteroidales bacterium]